MKKRLTLILLVSVISTPLIFAQTYAKNGMVVSDNSIASQVQVGVDILKKGGNAVDFHQNHYQYFFSKYFIDLNLLLVTKPRESTPP